MKAGVIMSSTELERVGIMEQVLRREIKHRQAAQCDWTIKRTTFPSVLLLQD